MAFVNIGILAHVDAGKTSLTERLLFDAGLIDTIGSVDKGSTQTDSLEIERRRGITIKSAVVALRLGDLHVTIIDTPGHSDFVAEVERALRVLDGAVLVVSAVEGVQARTRILMRLLIRMRIPVLIFVNKIDRMGARHAELIASIEQRLTPDCLVLSTVAEIGTRAATSKPVDPAGKAVAERLADFDDAILQAYVGDRLLSDESCARVLREQIRRARVYPVFFGSAITGEGVEQLTRAIAGLAGAERATESGTLRAEVFKIDRGRAGEKVAYARVFAGRVAARDRLEIFRREQGGTIRSFREKVTAVRVFDEGAEASLGVAGPGSIARLSGLTEVRIGDQLGCPGDPQPDDLFAPPALEAVIAPVRPAERAALFAALQRLAEQDPLIDVRRDRGAGTISVSLFGEVQKEVIAATLAEEFGIEVVFEESRTLLVERPAGIGEALEEIGGDGFTFFWATVGLRVEPAPPGTGTTLRLDVELGSLPLAFHKAIEESVHQTLRHGLSGWPVIDCAVTVIRTGYESPISAAGDFRNTTPLVVAAALRKAGTRVYEPMHRFTAEIPEDTVSATLTVLAARHAIADEHEIRADGTTVLRGTVAARQLHELSVMLPEVTRGEGLLLTEFAGYQPWTGPPRSRPHPGASPYDREQYMLHALGRVGSWTPRVGPVGDL